MSAGSAADRSPLYDFSLSADQARLVALSEALSRERLAARAAQFDREGVFPFADYDDLAEHGFTLMNVPREYGGLGADPLTYALVLKNIARANGSTALTLNMHSTICFFLTRLASEEQRRRFFGEAVRERKLFATTTSEPGISFRGAVRMEAEAEPVAGGYRVTALKHFCSLSTAASYYFAWATPPGQSFAKSVLVLAVPSDSPGIEILPNWDTMAMRATASNSLRFTQVFVPQANVIGQPGEIFAANVVDRFGLGYCAAYLGVAEAAYEYAHTYAATKSFLPDPEPISHRPPTYTKIAEMSVMLECGDLMMRWAAQAVAHGDNRERALALSRAKYYIGELALQVGDLALKVVGGRGIYRSEDLERFVRDTRPAPLMPPSGDRCLETIGKLLFNIPVEMFDTR